jgi:hypothetical protein
VVSRGRSQVPVTGCRAWGQARIRTSPTTASFFYSCNIPAHNANAPAFREMAQAIKMAPASHAPPPNNAASDDELLERLCSVAKTGVVQYRVQDVAQFGWSLFWF